jgi:ATP-dependent Clp protease ATP-binding subunit ClpC
MTSNLGSQEFQRQSLGFHRGETKTEQQQLRSAVESALKQTFRPEFLNRIDEVIVFEPLTEEQIRQIVALLMKEVQKRLSERGITLELTEEAKEWLATEGFDPFYGARPLKRAIQRYVESPLSMRILNGEFEEGDSILITADENKLQFSKR